GMFAPPVYYPTASTAARVTVADLNGDGKPDLILAGQDQSPAVRGAVTVLLNRGAGTFGPPTTYITLQGADGPPITVNRPAVADFNLDGKPDLVVPIADQNLGRVAILLGKGDGTFAPPIFFGTGKGTIAVAVADFDGDGWPDLAVANNRDENLAVLLNNGNGNFNA